MLNNLKRFDSYKAGHTMLYPKDLNFAYAYLEAREGGKWDETVWFGLQYYLFRYLQNTFYTLRDVDEAEAFWSAHFGRSDYFPADLWREMYDTYHGRLPLVIKALPEGTVVPTGTPLMSVENTDPRYPFLTGLVETLLMKVWYPTTIATQSYQIKKSIKYFWDNYSDNPDSINFAVHDFGYRGVASEEQAELGGAAHLLSFNGTDNVAGIDFAQSWYMADAMVGFSIPASEHSVILSWERERDAFANMLDTYPTGMIACVSDTYDLWNAVDNLWGDEFKDQILNRDGVLVVRPDSGNPKLIPAMVLSKLWDRFGGTFNSKGCKVLDPHIRVIQGDGMDEQTIPALYKLITSGGYAPENMTVGSGGGLLQKVNRDTLRFAYKVSNIHKNGQSYDVRKTPKTDMSKQSKAGRFDEGLVTVFRNGAVVNTHKFSEVKERIS